MSDKSVSQIANDRREKDHEASRKSVSPNKGKTQNPIPIAEEKSRKKRLSAKAS